VTVLEMDIRDAKFAVVSINTTGLTPGYDKICELSVVVAEPGDALRLSLDTIIDPHRPMACGAVHGIYNRHARSSPTFDEAGVDLLRGMQGRIVVSHNMPYLLRFLVPEFKRLKIPCEFPYLDTMSLTAMLSRKPPRALFEACDDVGVEPALSPLSAASALDTGKLLRALMAKISRMGVQTVGQLVGKRSHPFQHSLHHHRLQRGLAYGMGESILRRSRYHRDAPESRADGAINLYWQSLCLAIAGPISATECHRLMRLQGELEIDTTTIHMLHSRVFAGNLVAIIESGECTRQDMEAIASLRQALSILGWCPGDETDPL